MVGLANVDNTADTNKNVLSATKLTTARTISLSGGATGSVSFDGSANADIAVTVVGGGGGGDVVTVKTETELRTAVTTGGSILIKDSTITLTQRLNITTPCVIEGMNAKIVDTGYKIVIANTNNVTIKNLELVDCPIRLDGALTSIKLLGLKSRDCTGSTGCNIHVEVANSDIDDLLIEGCDLGFSAGYASLAIMGNNNKYKNVVVRNNFIHDTVNFGIEFLGTSVTTSNFLIEGNRIWDIGSQRSAGVGNGAGGVYTSGSNQGVGVRVIGHAIRRVLEICVEG
jgi:hypothetical protein